MYTRLMKKAGLLAVTALLSTVQVRANPEILFERSTDSALAVWFMNGANRITGPLLNPAFPADAGWQITGSGDSNLDGKKDIYFQHTDSTLAVWLMDGIDRLINLILNPTSPGNINWRVRATADFNSDGKTDLLFQHAVDGTILFWYMNGTTKIGSANTSIVAPGDTWKVKGAGDFNTDGKADIVFQRDNGDMAVWLLNGTNVIGQPLINPLNPGSPSWRLRSTGDLNKDGKTDLVFQHDSGLLSVWHLDGVNLPVGGNKMLNPDDPGPGWLVMATVDFDANSDRDLDTLTLVQEAIIGTNPNAANSDSKIDLDANGIPDYPGRSQTTKTDAEEDFDGDELSNKMEFDLGKNPLDPKDNLLPKKLLVYYGFPSLIFGSGVTNNAAEFAKYAYVVLGAGLEQTSHDDHTPAFNVISNTHRINPNTKFFGYISLITPSATDLTNKLNLWKQFNDKANLIMSQNGSHTNHGLQGIFIDDFELDRMPSTLSLSEKRLRMRDMVNHTHGLRPGFGVIANGYQTVDIFVGHEPPLNIGTNDFYFHEHHQIKRTDYVADPHAEWYEKVSSAFNHSLTRGFKILSLTSEPDEALPGFNTNMFFYSWHSALLFAHEATGWGEPDHSSDSHAPMRQRPSRVDAGNIFGNDADPSLDADDLPTVVSHVGNDYVVTRNTYWPSGQLGTNRVDTAAKQATFSP